MSVSDVIKKSILQGFANTDMSAKTIAMILIVAGLLGIYIFFVYRIMTVNTFYSKNFNISLILMCVITTAIILTIQQSVIVSLGMVGALSIVRFRTAVKDPLDLIFMFWSISVGIISGAGLIFLAIVVSLGVTMIVLFFSFLPEVRKSMILVINASDNECAKDIYEIISKYDSHYHLKSRNLTKENVDFLVEVRIKKCEELLEELNKLPKVTSVSLIAHRGEGVN